VLGMIFRDASQDDRERKTRQVLIEALERDEQADERDQVADKRDMSAHLDWFLRRNQTQNNDEAAQRARMSASRDRMDFKSDRTSSPMTDRSSLRAAILRHLRHNTSDVQHHDLGS